MKPFLLTIGVLTAVGLPAGVVVMAGEAQLPPAQPPLQQVRALPAEPGPFEVEPEPIPPPAAQPYIAEPVTPLPPTHADASGALSLYDLEQIALRCNPTLVQAAMAVRASKGECIQAGLYPNPVVGYIGDEIGNDRTAGLQGGFVSQEIVTAGKLRLGRAVARHDVQGARFGWEVQQRRVLNDVRAGYYDVLLAQKTIDVTRQLVRIGQESLRITEKLRQAQEISLADVLQARVEAERAELGLNMAENRHRAAWRRLAAVLGNPDMEPAPLDGDVEEELPAFRWESVLRRLLVRSPELNRARVGVGRARCELAHQCAERAPNFEIGSAVKYDDGSHFTVVDLEVAVSLPLFDRNQGNICKAHSDLIAAHHEVRRVALNLRDRLAVAFEQYDNARRQVETYTRAIVPNAKASWELISTGYAEGEFGYLTLLTAQRTFFSVNLEYLTSLAELWARTVALEGMLLSGGLEAPE